MICWPAGSFFESLGEWCVNDVVVTIVMVMMSDFTSICSTCYIPSSNHIVELCDNFVRKYCFESETGLD
ncbi:hypothetical protein QVD17_32748 [Tagetes erecta]|uniref:Uncharacterized protein n=1 Tax=Tagetes erecta TaxID=13708 RepID=A0AAD8NK83_TARER|nr:hypothetical protein QVD17_32748 [Tagetes erecta]